MGCEDTYVIWRPPRVLGDDSGFSLPKQCHGLSSRLLPIPHHLVGHHSGSCYARQCDPAGASRDGLGHVHRSISHVLPSAGQRVGSGSELYGQDRVERLGLLSSFEECFRRLFLQPRKYMNRTGTLPYQVMFKQTYQMIKQTMGMAYAAEFSELFAEYLRALHWILPYPRDNRFMRTDHKEIWVWSNYLPMGSIFSRKSISLAYL